MTGEIASNLGVQVIRHDSNFGKGRALESLVAAAKILDPEVVVTIDGDDQHDPEDIPEVIEPVLSGQADIVIGVRPMDSGSMPRDRVFGNKVLDQLTSARAGRTLHDTQSGFRAYSAAALSKLSFRQDGMAVESQTLIDALDHGLRIREVPVSVRYDNTRRKRSRITHFSEVVDYVITRTIIDSPLLYLGLPGMVSIVAGVVAGVRVIDLFLPTHLVATGTAIVAAVLIISGTVLVATSLILKLITVRMRE
jgi:glycosyltransferase involved in cell wall biosynthesis